MKKQKRSLKRPISNSLRHDLETLRRTYQGSDLQSDPLRYVHRFDALEDVEVVGWIASALAFGRVASIFNSIEDVLSRLGDAPAAVLADCNRRQLRTLLRGFRHRWVGGELLADALFAIGQVQCRFRTLEQSFLSVDSPTTDLKQTISKWSLLLRQESRRKRDRGLAFLFPDPVAGSACKRTNLWLRWMVRKQDGIDLGCWKDVSSARLTMPVDTHVAFLSRALRLTTRKTPTWSMASEITAALKQLDPQDPVKYDWAMSRLGILSHCPERRDASICPQCPVYKHCHLS